MSGSGPSTWLSTCVFVLGGLALFVGGELWSTDGESAERPRLVVPSAQVELARQELQASLGRPLTPEEDRQAVDRAIDDELLLRLALEAGLDREPEIARRLAQIGSFVAAPNGSGPTEAETASFADEAKRLGLHRGDRVVRSLLIDRARRLVRAAVLAREPSDAAIEAHWRAHPERYATPEQLALEVVVLGRGLDHGRLAAVDAGELARGHDEALERWPSLPLREIERRLGAVGDALATFPVNAWSGPLRCRDGACLVRVASRTPAGVAPLDEVRDAARAAVRQQLADRWLAARLELLREQTEVVVEESGRTA